MPSISQYIYTRLVVRRVLVVLYQYIYPYHRLLPPWHSGNVPNPTKINKKNYSEWITPDPLAHYALTTRQNEAKVDCVHILEQPSSWSCLGVLTGVPCNYLWPGAVGSILSQTRWQKTPYKIQCKHQIRRSKRCRMSKLCIMRPLIFAAHKPKLNALNMYIQCGAVITRSVLSEILRYGTSFVGVVSDWYSALVFIKSACRWYGTKKWNKKC